jgi:hypothetical protein
MMCAPSIKLRGRNGNGHTYVAVMMMMMMMVVVPSSPMSNVVMRVIAIMANEKKI